MEKEKLTIAIPQWQGGGQDLRTYRGAYAFADNYMGDEEVIFANISDSDLSPLKNDILGYDDILESVRTVKCILQDQNPKRSFTIGGGCDADVPCMTYLNGKYGGDMAVVYLDAHGDLNSPESSPSGNLHGMPLRAMLGECDKGILELADSVLKPEQIIMVGTRDCDSPEEEFIRKNQIVSLRSELVNENPKLILDEIKKKGSKNVFIHVDIDVIDPTEFPYQPVPAANGVREKAFCEMLELVKENCNIVGMCILGYTEMPDGEEKDKALETLVQMGGDAVKQSD